MKKFNILLVSILFVFSCSGHKKQQLFKATGNGLGTTYNISYYSDEDIALQPQLDSIFNVINSSMSTYHKDSDISKLNRGEVVEVDKHFINVFEASKIIYNNTNGYFDPSIGPLVNAYGFGPAKPLDTLNDSIKDSLLKKIGLKKFDLVDKNLRTDVQGFYLDFNAIAKGYTVDVIAGHLKRIGLTNYFVELGGEIVAVGQNIDKDTQWKFGIEKPIENNAIRDLTHAISLKNQALATSGNYRKYRVDKSTGQKYVHTVNPITGNAEKSNVLSASVVAKNCMIADAYATSFMAMGYERSLSVILDNNLSALLIYVNEDNKIQYFNTDNLNNQITLMD